MPKNIVLCSDGTGNSGGKGRGTNVWRIFNAVDLNGHKWDTNKVPQVAFHDDGVGTQSNVLLKALGGALGLGLKRNICQIYTFLVKNYDPNDKIFLFGFSRGAYTIRALGGLIAKVGIIDHRKYDDEELKTLVKQAVTIHRRNFQTDLGNKISSVRRMQNRLATLATRAERFRQEHAVKHAQSAPGGVVDICFIGVWDTVDAYGFPFDQLADFWHYMIYPFRFPNMRISEHVNYASHAISIDDERHTFHPVLWDEDETTAGRVRQVWFPGVHSNVGGGYSKDGLALVSLDWMMSEAENSGLRFLDADRAKVQDSANAFDKLYNSRSGPGIYYRYKPRDIGKICAKHNIKVPNIHTSTFQRIKSSVEGYAPGNLPADFHIVGTEHERPAVDESKERLDELGSSITSNLEAPLLENVAGCVYLRRFLHYIFIAITFAVFVVAWAVRETEVDVDEQHAVSWLGAAGRFFGSIPDWLFDFLIKPFMLYPGPMISTVLGSLVLIWAVGAHVRGKMHRMFATFWRATFAGAEGHRQSNTHAEQ